MRIVEWTPLALEDLASIDAYWWRYSPERAETILQQIGAAALFLTGTPEAGPEMERAAARKWRVRRTDHIITYRVAPNRIEILRVRHSAENWRDAL